MKKLWGVILLSLLAVPGWSYTVPIEADFNIGGVPDTPDSLHILFYVDGTQAADSAADSVRVTTGLSSTYINYLANRAYSGEYLTMRMRVYSGGSLVDKVSESWLIRELDDSNHVKTIANNAITASAIAADAIGASELAANALGASELGSDAASEIRQTVLDSSSTGSERSLEGLIKIMRDSLYAILDTAQSQDGWIASATSLNDAIDSINAIIDTLQNQDNWVSSFDATTDSVIVDVSAADAADGLINKFWLEDTSSAASGMGAMLKDTSAYQASVSTQAAEISDSVWAKNWTDLDTMVRFDGGIGESLGTQAYIQGSAAGLTTTDIYDTIAILINDSAVVRGDSTQSPVFKQLRISDDNGTAGSFIVYNGTGTAVKFMADSGNSNNGHGIHFDGAGTGAGVCAFGGNSGPGAYIRSGGPDYGMEIYSTGSNAAIKLSASSPVYEKIDGSIDSIGTSAFIALSDSANERLGYSGIGDSVTLQLKRLILANNTTDQAPLQINTNRDVSAVTISALGSAQDAITITATDDGVWYNTIGYPIDAAGDTINAVIGLTGTAIDNVWDEDSTGHTGGGTMGEAASQTAATALTAAGLAEAVWAHDDTLDVDTSRIGVWLTNNTGGSGGCGSGLATMRVYAYDTTGGGSDAVEDVDVTVRTMTNGFYGDAETNSSGYFDFSCDSADSFIILMHKPGYTFPKDTVEITTGGTQTVNIQGYETLTESKCRVWGYTYDVGATAMQGVKVTAKLVNTVEDTCSNTIIGQDFATAYSDDTGYWYMDLLRSKCLDRAAKYNITIQYGSYSTGYDRQEIPDSSTYRLTRY